MLAPPHVTWISLIHPPRPPSLHPAGHPQQKVFIQSLLEFRCISRSLDSLSKWRHRRNKREERTTRAVWDSAQTHNQLLHQVLLQHQGFCAYIYMYIYQLSPHIYSIHAHQYTHICLYILTIKTIYKVCVIFVHVYIFVRVWLCVWGPNWTNTPEKTQKNTQLRVINGKKKRNIINNIKNMVWMHLEGQFY